MRAIFITEQQGGGDHRHANSDQDRMIGRQEHLDHAHRQADQEEGVADILDFLKFRVITQRHLPEVGVLVIHPMSE